MKSLIVHYGLMLTFLLSLSEQTDQNELLGTPIKRNPVAQGTDCSQIKTIQPNATSGVYVIQPPGTDTSFKVYCEMRPDGGWAVFQRRSGGAVSFERKWEAYKDGFGNLTDDHWLGLSKVFSLTKSKQWTLRVDLWDHEDGIAFAEYSDFRLGNETENFKLNVGQYSGNAGDAIRGHYPGVDQNGFGFSTIDRDNDGCNPYCVFGDIAEHDCSSENGGGWWFGHRCGSADLNGNWHPAGDNIGWAKAIYWLTWKGPAPYSARATRMMIKQGQISHWVGEAGAQGPLA